MSDKIDDVMQAQLLHLAQQARRATSSKGAAVIITNEDGAAMGLELKEKTGNDMYLMLRGLLTSTARAYLGATGGSVKILMEINGETIDPLASVDIEQANTLWGKP